MFISRLPLRVLFLVLTGCSPFPKTEIVVRDRQGAPLPDFPLQVDLSAGLRDGRPFNGELPPPDAGDQRTFEIRTDDAGKAAVEYDFAEKRPPDWQILLFDAEGPGNQSVTVTPLDDLPAGSRIEVSFPNP